MIKFLYERIVPERLGGYYEMQGISENDSGYNK